MLIVHIGNETGLQAAADLSNDHCIIVLVTDSSKELRQ